MGTLAATAPTAPPKGCPVGRLMETLDKDDREAVAGVVAEHAISIRAVREWLADNGHPMNKDTISRHRDGKCRCVA